MGTCMASWRVSPSSCEVQTNIVVHLQLMQTAATDYPSASLFGSSPGRDHLYVGFPFHAAWLLPASTIQACRVFLSPAHGFPLRELLLHAKLAVLSCLQHTSDYLRAKCFFGIRGPRRMHCIMHSVPISVLEAGGFVPGQQELLRHPLEDFFRGYSSNKVDDQGSNIHCQLKLNKLLDVVIDTSTPPQNCCHRGEVIIQNDNIRALLCHFSSLNAHGKPNICFF